MCEDGLPVSMTETAQWLPFKWRQGRGANLPTRGTPLEVRQERTVTGVIDARC